MLRESASFRTENKVVVLLVMRPSVGFGCLFGKIEQVFALAVAQKIMPRCVHSKIDELPVVQAGALQMPIVNTKAQGLDQVERREGGRAKPRDATSIRGNLRLV